ncbi:hypothetical protein AMELA_G00010720, partial [Ameiurus melas]
HTHTFAIITLESLLYIYKVVSVVRTCCAQIVRMRSTRAALQLFPSTNRVCTCADRPTTRSVLRMRECPTAITAIFWVFCSDYGYYD